MTSTTTGRPGLVVMGRDSRSKGLEFESRHCILMDIFSYLLVVKVLKCVWKDEIMSHWRAWDFVDSLFLCRLSEGPIHWTFTIFFIGWKLTSDEVKIEIGKRLRRSCSDDWMCHQLKAATTTTSIFRSQQCDQIGRSFGKNRATFYSNIWSHWISVTYSSSCLSLSLFLSNRHFR